MADEKAPACALVAAPDTAVLVPVGDNRIFALELCRPSYGNEMADLKLQEFFLEAVSSNRVIPTCSHDQGMPM